MIQKTALITAWIAAIVIANNNIVWFGPKISILNAFFLIGLSITTRDSLHNLWHGKSFHLKMGALIVAGGLISYLTQPATGRIAMASITAFMACSLVDTFIYQKLFKLNQFKKTNGSNVAAAAVDSVLFPVLAFGGFPIFIILGQFFAKIFGGMIWSIIIQKKSRAYFFALLGISGASGANGMSIENHFGDKHITTINHFEPGVVQFFGFVDIEWDENRLVYGEAILTYTKPKINPTIQLEFGDANFFDVEEVVLLGIERNGLSLLVRSDHNIQVTYIWRYHWNRIAFNGFIDAWAGTNTVLLTKPQAWFSLNENISVGCMLVVSYNLHKRDDWSAVLYFSTRVSF